MTASTIEQLLEQVFADRQISRNERQVLLASLEEAHADESRLAALRSRAFELAQRETADPQAHAVLACLEDVLKALRPKAAHEKIQQEAYFNPGSDCGSKLVRLVNGASRTIDVCVYTITDDCIARALLDAKKRGVDLRIISDDEKTGDPGSDIARLARAGIPVRLERSECQMHHKFAMFDGCLLLTGSYNWTRTASRQNMENFIVSNDPRLLQAFSAEFERLWDFLA
jgi:mitochondrial cardiolipin hydrolase